MTEYGRIHTDGSRSGGQPLTKTQHCPNCEATEQKLHDFRQEVSDAVEVVVEVFKHEVEFPALERFIIPKPDPLVEIFEAWFGNVRPGPFRATLDALGYEIREKNDD